MKKYTCIVTDMDQVLCRTQNIHGAIESEVLNHYGAKVSSDEIARMFTGMGTDYVFSQYLDPNHVAEALAKKESKLEELSPRDIIEVEGAVNFFKKAESKFHLGLASGSSLAFIKLVVRALDVQKTFQSIASGEEVAHNKPAPDVFELALQRLGCEASNAIVIEDGISGIAAAKQIGALAIGITTSYKATRLKDAGADHVVDTFAEIHRLLEV